MLTSLARLIQAAIVAGGGCAAYASAGTVVTTATARMLSVGAAALRDSIAIVNTLRSGRTYTPVGGSDTTAAPFVADAANPYFELPNTALIPTGGRSLPFPDVAELPSTGDLLFAWRVNFKAGTQNPIPAFTFFLVGCPNAAANIDVSTALNVEIEDLTQAAEMVVLRFQCSGVASGGEAEILALPCRRSPTTGQFDYSPVRLSASQAGGAALLVGPAVKQFGTFLNIPASSPVLGAIPGRNIVLEGITRSHQMVQDLVSSFSAQRQSVALS